MASSYSIASAIKVAIVGDDRLSKQLSQIHGRVEKFGSGLAKAGANITRAVGLPLAGIGVVSMKAAMDMNKAMANIATLMPGNTKLIEQFKRQIQEMSIATGKSTGDLADGLYQVISALGRTPESINMLKVAARGAVAGVSDTKESIDLLAASVNAYANESDTAAQKTQLMQKASDIAFKTVSLGVTTFPELAASMGKVLPLASTLDTEMADLYATLAAGTKAGNATSEVTTQIASAYRAFLKPSKDMTKAVKKLGFQSSVAMVKEKGFGESVRLLGEHVGKSEEKLAKLFTRGEAQLIVFSLLGKQSKFYQDTLKELRDSAGSTSEAFREQTEGINRQGHQWEKLKKRAVVFAQRVGDKLLPMAERLFNRMEPWLEKIEKMDDATLDWYLSLAKIGIVAGPMLSIFGKLIVNLSSITKGFKLAKAGSSGLVNSINMLGGEIKGLPYSKMGKTQKFLTALQGAGAVLGAGAAGFGLGSLISEMIIEPHSKMQAEKTLKLEEKIFQFRQAARSKDLKKRFEAYKELTEFAKSKEYREELSANAKSAEGIAGQIASVFTDVESPMQRMERINKETSETIKMLRDSVLKDPAVLKQQQSSVNIKIENKSDAAKVRVNKTGDPISTTNRGMVMDGI